LCGKTRRKAKNDIKSAFFCQKVCVCQKKAVILQAFLKKPLVLLYKGAPENPLVFGESGGTEHLNEPVAAGEHGAADRP
jgi:hypothetical protein